MGRGARTLTFALGTLNPGAGATSYTVTVASGVSATLDLGDAHISAASGESATATTTRAFLDVCDGDGPCIDDHCVDGMGCVQTQLTGACVGDDLCAATAECVEGACVTTTTIDCDDGDSCSVDGCDPATGCTVLQLNDGTSCDDGSACTSNDACRASGCEGVAIDCDDGNICTDDSCDPDTGCVATNNTAPCDDGDLCSATDICQDGACVGTDRPTCDTPDICQEEGFCEPSTGECVYPFVECAPPPLWIVISDGTTAVGSVRCEMDVNTIICDTRDEGGLQVLDVKPVLQCEE